MIVMIKTPCVMGNSSETNGVNTAKLKSNPVMRSMQEIVKGVFLGSVVSHDFQVLNDCGITNVVSVLSKKENIPLFPDWFRYKVVELDDDSIWANVIPIIPQVKLYIDDCLRTNGKVLVHSYFGTSRSVVLVIGYIMETYKMTLEEAFKLVKDKRSCINPKEYLLNQLREYEVIYKARVWYNQGHSSTKPECFKRGLEDGESMNVEDACEQKKKLCR